MENELIPIVLCIVVFVALVYWERRFQRERMAIPRWVWILGCAAIAVVTSEVLSDYSIAWKMLAAGTASAIVFGVVDAVSRRGDVVDSD